MYRFRGANSDDNLACCVSVVVVCSGEANSRVFDGTGTSASESVGGGKSVRGIRDWVCVRVLKSTRGY
jgi:hypothetical protein